MGAMASEIPSLTIVCSTVCSDLDQRKHHSSASLAFVRGIHRWPVNSPRKGPVKRGKCFHLMTSSWGSLEHYDGTLWGGHFFTYNDKLNHFSTMAYTCHKLKWIIVNLFHLISLHKAPLMLLALVYIMAWHKAWGGEIWPQPGLSRQILRRAEQIKFSSRANNCIVNKTALIVSKYCTETHYLISICKQHYKGDIYGIKYICDYWMVCLASSYQILIECT